MPSESGEPRKPLQGLRMLAVEQFGAGPFGTMMMADLGCEVIKIERPGIGDGIRTMGPAVERDGQTIQTAYQRYNRNKKSVTLDLNNEEGRRVFKELVKVSDIVLENFRPGVMDRLGVGYDVLRDVNPSIIYAAVNGFGSDGPFRNRAAFDLVAVAMGGMMNLTGTADGPPLWAGTAVADLYASVLVCWAVTIAAYHRLQTGQGQRIDVSMYEAIVGLVERCVFTYGMTGQVLGRGKPHELLAPWGSFPTKNGWVVVAVINEGIWARLCRAIGRDDLIADERCTSNALRAANAVTLINPVVTEWTSAKTREEVVATLEEFGVPCGPVQTAEDLFHCPQLASRGALLEIDHPVLGKVTVAGNAMKFSLVPEIEANVPPELGEQTEDVLGTLLGYTTEEIERLRRVEAI